MSSKSRGTLPHRYAARQHVDTETSKMRIIYNRVILAVLQTIQQIVLSLIGNLIIIILQYLLNCLISKPHYETRNVKAIWGKCPYTGKPTYLP